MDTSKIVYASFFLRFSAAAIDWIIITTFSNIIGMIVIFFLPFNLFAFSMLYISLYLVATITYSIFFTFKYRGTLGKKFIGLEIGKENGVLTLQDAIRREIVLKPISILLFGFGILYMFFNFKKQTFYDKRLGLVVVVKSKLSLIKLILGVIVSLFYFLYLLGWTRSYYTILNFKNEQNKTDMVYEIKQKVEVLKVVESHEGTKLGKFAQTTLSDIDKIQQEFCSKQIMNFFLRRKSCLLEELNNSNLIKINTLYENAIKRVVDMQSEFENK